MLARRLCLGLLAAGAALSLTGPASAARGRVADPMLAPSPTFAPAASAVPDRILNAAPRALADDQWWGGPITNSRGETFRFYVSSQYAVDEGARARWANFLGWALHGKELAKLNVYQAPISRVRELCGSDAVLACYYPQDAKLIFPGDNQDPVTGPLNLSEILLHEYGHHVATNRRNDPWQAFAYGPKRWASAENICRRASRYQVWPGNESHYYLLNPGEAYAETYRLLNVRRAQRSNAEWYASWGEPLPWQWVAFSKTDSTLAAARADVEQPWTHGRTLHWSGRTARTSHLFTPHEHTAERRVITPLDGTITLVLNSAPRGSSIAIERGLGLDQQGRKSVTAQVCGESSLMLKVSTPPARGRFRVTIRLP